MKPLELAFLEKRPSGVLTLGVGAFVVSLVISIIAFAHMGVGTMMISLPGKRSSLDVGEVNALAFGLASFTLVLTSVWWTLLTSFARKVNQLQVIWVPIIVVLLVGGFTTYLLSVEPVNNSWGIAGGAFGTLLYAGAVALLSSIAWKALKIELIKEDLGRNIEQFRRAQ